MSVNQSDADYDVVLHIDVGSHGDLLVMSVRGEVDALTAPGLQAEIENLREIIERTEQYTALVIDLSKVGFLGSAGLSVLQFAAQMTEPRPLRVTASPVARRVIQVTGLDRLVDLYDDLPSALADASPEPAVD
ncbi:STAS domain-containing protein [Nocardia alni]|uniref:STAS domain-containing protein n=1 Tax=Nocardia alni TaxID=2815723 RepID=UPI001C22046B|nr:STAS domain-containing protein [Nocardia alni]